MLHFTPLDHPEPPPFERVDGAPESGVLVVCDHASPVIPGRYGELGLSGDERLAHIAWDIGAALVSKGLARRLGCPAVLAGISRLVIDCNRQPGDPCSIPTVSGGIPVPGNAAVDDPEADARAESWFWPYHHEIGTQLAHLFRHRGVPAMVSVHSFTPCLGAEPRPWHVGVLSNRDRRMAEPLLAALAMRGELVVGDNQPYSGREINYTLDTHAGAAGLPHISFEIRQDLLADEAACEHWAELLALVLNPVLADEALRQAIVY
ncbi:MAG TPA: N-formylglutamate amidohydrolase [Magnetospirillum sp.]|jgi:predicted N-formylglutamate amidohydrolase|nr:N-formylglutamate amidohydrolase [Magnetospirillum sp.]